MSNKKVVDQKTEHEEKKSPSNAAQWDILAKSPIAMLVSRLSDGVMLFVNQRGGDLVGFSMEELIGQATPDFYQDPADRQTVLGTIQKQGFLRDYELVIKQKDGTPIWILLSVEPIVFDGEPALLSSLQDITAQKEAEAQVDQTVARQQQILDISPAGILVTRIKEGTILFANQAIVL